MSAVPDLVGTRPSRTERRRPQRRTVLGALAMLALLVALLPFYSGSTLASCGSTVVGAPGDGTSGSVWLNWAWDETGGSPFTSTQDVTGAGRGDPLWQPVMTVNSAWSIPMWGLSRLSGPVCGYNLVIAAGMVTTGMAMWAVTFAITRSRLAAMLAGQAYAFTAFAQIKSGGHLSGVMLAAFPLLIFALLRLWARPSPRRAAVAAVPWAFLAYTDGYYLAFALILTGGFVAGAAVVDLAVERSSLRRTATRIASVALAGVITLVLLIPFALATLGDRAAIDSERTRSLADVDVYGARPWEYLLPAAENPLIPERLRDWRYRNVHGSNLAESTLYVGWVVLILAAIATTWTVVSRRRARRAGAPRGAAPEIALAASGPAIDAARDAPPEVALEPVPSPTLPPRTVLVGALFGVLFVAAFSSLGPSYELFGVNVPMPSRFVHRVFPQMRVFSRLFVVVSCAAVVLAAVGFCDAVRRIRQPWAVRSLAVVLGLFTLGEGLAYEPFSPPQWSFAQVPLAYEEAGDDPDVGLVALYPSSSASEDPDKMFLTFQLALDRPLLNSVTDSDSAVDSSDVARGLAALDDPQTIPALRALGVDTLFVRVQRMGRGDPTTASRLGLDLVRSYRYDVDDAPRQKHGGAARWAYLATHYDIDEYRIGNGPVARAAAALGSGWSFFETEEWAGSRWMTGEGQLTVVPFAGATGTAVVGFHAVAFAFDREVEVLDGDQVVARFRVSPAGTDVRFDAPIGRTLRMRSTPGPTPISEITVGSTDSRLITILVSELSVD